MFNRFLNHLEEWLISSFMAAATLVAFAAVVMRYTTGGGISWAQELTIYLFIWMAKFGAAYGVRTGIHIGVDFVVNAANPPIKRILVIAVHVAGRDVHRCDRFFRRALGHFHLRHRPGIA